MITHLDAGILILVRFSKATKYSLSTRNVGKGIKSVVVEQKTIFWMAVLGRCLRMSRAWMKSDENLPSLDLRRKQIAWIRL